VLTVFGQATANPLLRMPPGARVPFSVSSMTDNGAIAARCGGCSCATNNCEIPGYEMPTMPTLWCATHGCAAIVSTMS
jgi:hypothetical protein